ncbi:hypothetical protein FTO74_14405 [Granulicella sp. WH15]|uniref:phage virion morphogenesis protein n=1 Tax=Granulicella sp. WH15 TaxID=2602070 RepID=UPI0013677A50|nr:phage virion morphogenesis protein [Granulicella sp. WH15]QHN04424.1 hypothetical protein FTO74_14405 [Granulicella sp. WH15]
MAASVQVNDRAVLLSLGDYRASISDRAAMYRILGRMMVDSIHLTMVEQGSPSGSWVPFALSTTLRKGFKPHKLLYLLGNLFRSIRFDVKGDEVVVGTGSEIPYAAVQNFGSADLAGSTGPQARIEGRQVKVGAYDYSRRLGFGRLFDRSARGRKAAIEGPGRKISVPDHERYQNIPARPFAVLRPEDPQRFVEALDLYIAGRGLAAGGVA